MRPLRLRFEAARRYLRTWRHGRRPTPAAGSTPVDARPRANTRTPATARSRGAVFEGTVWRGGTASAIPDAAVVVDAAGRVAAVGPRATLDVADLPRYGGAGCWVGPGVVDTHVEYGVASADDVSVSGGVLAVRDLTDVAVRALLMGPGSREEITSLVRVCAAGGKGWLSLRLQEGDDPTPGRLRALAAAAHEAGLAYVVHTRDTGLALRSVEAGADSLAAVPLDEMDDDAIETLASCGASVTPLLQQACASGHAWVAARNAAALHAAGVTLLYGTGSDRGAPPTVDPRELERLAAAGLGRRGALRAATDLAVQAPGLGSVGLTGRIDPGHGAGLVVLSADPMVEPVAWRSVLAVCVGDRVSSGSAWPRTPEAVPVPTPARPAAPVPAR